MRDTLFAGLSFHFHHVSMYVGQKRPIVQRNIAHQFITIVSQWLKNKGIALIKGNIGSTCNLLQHANTADDDAVWTVCWCGRQ